MTDSELNQVRKIVVSEIQSRLRNISEKKVGDTPLEAFDLANKNYFDLNHNIFKKTAYWTAEVNNGNSGSSKTIDWSAGNKQVCTITATCTFTFSPPPGGACNLVFRLVKDNTNTPYGLTFPGSVKWPGGAVMSLTSSANSADICCFYYNGANYYAQASNDFR